MFLSNTDWDGEITKLAINFDFLVKQFPHINHFCIKRSALVQAQRLLGNFDHRLKKQQLNVSGFSHLRLQTKTGNTCTVDIAYTER